MARYNIIYKDQTAVRLILDTELDLQAEGYASSKIGYKKPDGTTGEWIGALLNPPGTDGKIYYDFASGAGNNFDSAGDWVVWAEITYGDGRVGYGIPKYYNVKIKGTPPN
jgi:hypothetical protein